MRHVPKRSGSTCLLATLKAESAIRSDSQESVRLVGYEWESAARYDRCVMCQTAGRSRIQDFRTRGEQPFTALIETQFAEQPPQTLNPKLPNHGRKVLVFSDGRQKAARLAPALEHSHARDLFRQVIALAVDEMRKQQNTTGMQYLYPAVVWLCANWGVDLFPSAEEHEFHNHINRVKSKTLEQAIKLSNQEGSLADRVFCTGSV